MDDALEALERRASTLDELLSDRFVPLPGAKNDAAAAAARLSAWCIAAAGGDWQLFARRLARDGLTLEAVLPRLATVRRNPETHAPGWLADAVWILEALRTTGSATTPDPAREEPIAFEPLLARLVEIADEEVRARARTAEPVLGAAAIGQLRRALLRQLSALCAPALFDALLAWKARRVEAGVQCTERAAATDDDLFERFVQHLQQGGIDRLLAAKPVLLRLIASVTRHWIESTAEFTARLQGDVSDVRRSLLGTGSPSRVAAVEGGLSDPHDGGRSVLLVTFEDGQRVLYKPKDLRPDAFWQRLVDWLNDQEAPIDLRTARVLLRDGYGWAAFVGATDCRDARQIERFYERAGAWLALFHVFAAADMHFENLIAAGEHPVPIDLEMLLQSGSSGDPDVLPERAAFEEARRRIDESITATGFLPAYARTPENAIIGLGGLNESQTEITEPCWEEVNTARMRPGRRQRTGRTYPNLPSLAGAPAPLGPYLESLQAGFDRYAHFLVRQRERILEEPFLEALQGVDVRRLLRPTRFYAFLLERLRDHRRMGDGAAWSAQLDFAARLSEWDRPDPLWPLLRAERLALAALDVPLFRSTSDAATVADRSGHSARDHAVPGLARARTRLRAFDEAELAWQRRILSVSTVGMPGSSAAARPSDRAFDTTTTERLAPTSFLAAARGIADRIAEQAIRRGPGAAWIGLDWLGDAEVSQLVPLGFDLYNGAPGIALFLAAHAHVTGDAEAAALSIAALAPLRSHLHGANAGRLARGLGLGGASGLGSVVYALCTIGTLLDDGELLVDAHRAACLCTDELIEADRLFDVMGGSAGGILGLLTLHRLAGDAAALERAVRCGRHLLRHGVPPPGTGSGLSTPGRPFLTGFSHGAAGYGYALTALHRATGEEAFARSAQAWIAAENHCHSPARANWPDLRQGAREPSWPCQWCYGAAGIGLARIATARCSDHDDARLTADVREAVRGTLQAPPCAVDHLCCGTAGQVEFLAEAAAFLHEPSLQEVAERRLLGLIADAGSTGGYRWTNGDDAFNPGLFRGLSGVGYSMLRRMAPALPNLLIWS